LLKLSKPFNIYVEVDSSLKEATPFNLLPINWVNHHFAIDLASSLPYNSINFSYEWMSANNFYGMSPMINFYPLNHIDLIRKVVQNSDTNNIFFAFESNSIDLIKKYAIPDSTIVITYIKYENELKNYPTIFVENKTPYQIIPELYLKILEKLVHCETFDHKNIELIKFKDSFIAKKKFLPAIKINNSLLCKSNEIVFSRARGKLPIHLEPTQSENLDPDEYYLKNINLTNEIISEKRTDYFLSLYSDGKIETVNIPKYVLKSGKKILKKEKTAPAQKNVKNYISIKKGIHDVENLYVSQEIILLIPSVNIACKNAIIENLQLKFDGKYKTEIKTIIESILKGGKAVTFSIPTYIPEEESKKLEDMCFRLGFTRDAENSFLTSLVSLYASRKLSPVLKTVTVPSSLFIKLNMARYNLKSRGSYEAIMNYFFGIQQELALNFPSNYHELISELNVDKYTIFSDLPFELMITGDNETFCQKYEVTRIPITPLNLLLYNINNFNNLPRKIDFSSFNEVLHINSINTNDPIFEEYKLFKKTCEEQGYNLNFKHAKDSNDFVDLVNKIKPKILIYYGHATYNDECDKGQLIFEKDVLSFESLKKITDMPPIVFLIGCETASTSAFSGGIANHFLCNGAQAVLATLFPIPANHAASFIGRMLGMLNDYKIREVECSLARLVFKARKLGWLMDRIESLYEFELIDMREYFILFTEISNTLHTLSLKENRELTLIEAEAIFEQVLLKYGFLEQWDSIKTKTIPYSLFFTLLGRGHDIYL